MAATKSAAPKKTQAKKATSPKKAPAKRKTKTSAPKGSSAEAHKWLMESQGVDTEGLPPKGEIKAPPQEEEDDLDQEMREKSFDANGRFLPGNTVSKLGGRPKGSRNKLAEEFFNDFYNDWLVNGAEVIATVRREKPDVYFRGAVMVLPKQVDVRVSEFAELKDDALDQKIAEMQRELSAAMAILQPRGSA